MSDINKLTLDEYKRIKNEEFKLTAEEKYGVKRTITVRARFFDEVKAYADSLKGKYDKELANMTIEQLRQLKVEGKK